MVLESGQGKTQGVTTLQIGASQTVGSTEERSTANLPPVVGRIYLPSAVGGPELPTFLRGDALISLRTPQVIAMGPSHKVETFFFKASEGVSPGRAQSLCEGL